MKLIQLNAWNGRIEKPLVTFLQEQQADVLCLQEVIDIPDGEAGLFKNLDDVQTASNLKYRYFSPVFSFNFMNRTASYGNAILSNSAFASSDTVFTHGSFQDNYDVTAHGYNNRNLQHVTISLNGKSLHIINHHAYLVRGNKDDSEASLQQMGIVAEYIKTFDGPIILCGDFNLKPETKSIGMINSLLHNLSLEYDLATTSSILSTRPETRDYVFVNDLVRVSSFHASDEIVSDHKPLILEFEL